MWIVCLFFRSLRTTASPTMPFCATVASMPPPYMEASVGIENIFKFLRIDYVWRMSYRNHPDIQKSGVRMTMVVSF